MLARARRVAVRLAVLGTAGGASALAYLAYRPPADRQPFPLPDDVATRHPLYLRSSHDITPSDKRPEALWTPPSRSEALDRLRASKPGAAPSDILDLVVIGGGATGAGVALDAATRGLKVAVLDRYDFASGTSSKSTKLIHGGVRYLEKAFWNLDIDQFNLVRGALHERGIFLRMCPFLTYQIPTLIPLYQFWKVPYYWAGCKVYDFLAMATGEGLTSSYILPARDALTAFPTLKPDGLKAALVYYDGAQNDSRMNVSLIMTAVAYGALAINHTEVVNIIKRKRVGALLTGQSPEQICGVRVRDHITGKEFDVACKGVINAAGPFIDGIRTLDSGIAETKPMVSPSSGIHLTLPGYFTPKNLGLIDPKTSDGRVLFFLPWQGSTILGTTDSPCKIEQSPVPEEEDIRWLITEAKKYFSPDLQVRDTDVLSAWSGIRPLVTDPHAKNTESLVRNHLIITSPSGLLTISGGKWTTFREMAEETVDTAVKLFDLKPKNPCVTPHISLIGSYNWSPTFAIKLMQNFGVNEEIAEHLSHSYGDRAWKVLSYGNNNRIAENYPYLESEITYAIENEYACTVMDVLARRLRLTFLNTRVSEQVLPRVVEIMGNQLGWSERRRTDEIASGKEFLVSMGSKVLAEFDAKHVEALRK